MIVGAVIYFCPPPPSVIFLFHGPRFVECFFSYIIHILLMPLPCICYKYILLLFLKYKVEVFDIVTMITPLSFFTEITYIM